MFRYPISVRQVPDSSETEVACHVRRVSVRVSGDDPDFAAKIVEFLDHHQDCTISLDLTDHAPDQT